MNRNLFLCKTLVIVVIVLFTGVAVAPSINANEELIEYTTEVIGLDVGKRTVKLTKEQSQEVELLLDTAKEKLGSTNSMEEAKDVYKETVIELNKYGLLAGLNIEEAQNLVIKDLSLNNRLGIDIGLTQNLFCLFLGTAHVWTGDIVPEIVFSLYPGFILGFILGLSIMSVFENLGLLILMLLFAKELFSPFKFMNLVVCIGSDWDAISYGLKGIVESEWINLIFGFTGLRIITNKLHETHDENYLGFCLGII